MGEKKELEMDNPDSEYYSAREVAEKLGVHRQTVYYWIYTDKIPNVKIGSIRRIPKKEFEDWLKKRTIIP